MKRLILLLALVMILAACGGGEEEDAPQDNPAPTVEPAQDDEEPVADPLPPGLEGGPPLSQTQALPFELEGSGPPGAPPGSGQAENAPFVPPGGDTGGPPFLQNTPSVEGEAGSDMPQQAQPGQATGFATEFGDLAVGEPAIIAGTLAYEDKARLIDSQGNRIALAMTEPMRQLYSEGETLQITGIVAEDDDGELIVRNLLVYADTENVAPDFGQGNATPNVQAPGVPAFMEADFQLDAGLTALETYDQLVLAASDAVLGLDWVLLSGSPTVGWQVQFLNSETGEGEIYRVNPDGSVRVQGVAAGSLPAIYTVPIDRSRVTVDSDDALSFVAANYDLTDSSSLRFDLRANDDGGILWFVLGGEVQIDPFDATG